MTQRQFDARVRELLDQHLRRVRKLQDVLQGKHRMKEVHVRSYRVKSYVVRSHVRFV